MGYIAVAQGLLIPFLGTTLGAALVFFLRREMPPHLSKVLVGFAAGVMVAASFWGLLQPALEEAADMGTLSFVPAASGARALYSEKKEVERRGRTPMTKMEAGIARDDAFALLSEHNKEAFHIEHAETLEGTMRYFAREFDPENEEFWGVVGLLHDLDWEEYPQLEVHTIKAEPWLRAAGGTDELVHAIQSHNFAAQGCPEPELFMEKVLYAVDELTGLIGAAVLMRPSKSVMDLPLKSLKKKFKDKRFAAGCSRDVIRQGAELCGWELDELMERTIAAMQSFAPDRDTFVPVE